MKKNSTETLKITCEDVHEYKGFLKIQLFHRYFEKIFAETFQNACWEKYTFQWHLSESYSYFLWDCNNFPWQKYTKQYFSWCYKHRNWKSHVASLLKSIYYEYRAINLYLEGRHLVLALFAIAIYNSSKIIASYLT